jgi:hypothetical protein
VLQAGTRAFPYALQAAASAGAYTLSLLTMQARARALCLPAGGTHEQRASGGGRPDGPPRRRRRLGSRRAGRAHSE